jgi:hypothetical protein
MRRSIEMIVLAIIAFPMWGGAVAEAGPLDASLRGDYSMTLSRVCAVANQFDSNFAPITGFPPLVPSLLNITVQGTFTYNGTGGGSFVGESLATVPGEITPVVSSANRANQSCTVSYTVNANGTFTQTLNCNLTFTNGGPPPAPGQTGTLVNIVLDGRLSLDGTVLLIGDATPNVEQFTITSGTNAGQFNQRVCNGNGSATSRR